MKKNLTYKKDKIKLKVKARIRNEIIEEFFVKAQKKGAITSNLVD